MQEISANGAGDLSVTAAYRKSKSYGRMAKTLARGTARLSGLHWEIDTEDRRPTMYATRDEAMDYLARLRTHYALGLMGAQSPAAVKALSHAVIEWSVPRSVERAVWGLVHIAYEAHCEALVRAMPDKPSGRALRASRHWLGLTQTEAGQAVGWCARTWSAFESGDKAMRMRDWAFWREQVAAEIEERQYQARQRGRTAGMSDRAPT